MQGVKDGDWKLRRLIIRSNSGFTGGGVDIGEGSVQDSVSIELYNVTIDPSERNNQADEYPGLVNEMIELLDNYPAFNP